MAEYSFAMYFALAFAMYIDAKKKNGVLLSPPPRGAQSKRQSHLGAPEHCAYFS